MPACTTPELWPVWWVPISASRSSTTIRRRGSRRPSSRATARPRIPAPTTTTSAVAGGGGGLGCGRMKAVILAGGRGSRLGEETSARPKPMVEIGGKPILWHVMKNYSSHGIEDFVICLGYRGYLIKEYFANYFLHTCDVTFDVARGAMEVHESTTEPWRVTLVDTGEDTMTGGRPRRGGAPAGGGAVCVSPHGGG